MGESLKENMIPDSQSAEKIIASDKELNKFKKLLDYIVKAKKDGYPIEAFMVAYQVIQEIEMPRPRKMVLNHLGLKGFDKKFDEERSIYSENLEYLALTHDIELFNKLESARKIRNELAHKLTETEDLQDACTLANHALKGTFLNLLEAIKDRWNGVKSVPVLALYANGWNDCRKQTLKNLGFEED